MSIELARDASFTPSSLLGAFTVDLERAPLNNSPPGTTLLTMPAANWSAASTAVGVGGKIFYRARQCLQLEPSECITTSVASRTLEAQWIEVTAGSGGGCNVQCAASGPATDRDAALLPLAGMGALVLRRRRRPERARR